MQEVITKRTNKARKERQQRFLDVLAEKGQTVSSAAEAVGITRQTHHSWCKTDPDYRDQFERVLAETRPDFGTRVGRPSKYRQSVIGTICSAVSDGTPFTHAAAIAGISYQTFCEWRKQFPEFSEAVEAARAKGVQARLRLILAAAEGGDVSSARWWLEHVFPEHFSRNRVEHQHHVEGSLEHSHAVAPELLDTIASVRKRNEGN